MTEYYVELRRRIYLNGLIQGIGTFRNEFEVSSLQNAYIKIEELKKAYTPKNLTKDMDCIFEVDRLGETGKITSIISPRRRLSF